MYFYIYDALVAKPRYQRIISDIEAKLSLLDVKGPVARLHQLTKMGEVVRRALVRGATTIVAVGNDTTLLSLINALPKKDIACGIIPLAPPNELARELGVRNAEEGIETIAARKIALVTAGSIDGTFFLKRLELKIRELTAILNDGVTIKTSYPVSRFAITNPYFIAKTSKGGDELECELIPVVRRALFSKKPSVGERSKFFLKKLVIKSQQPIIITADDNKLNEKKSAVVTAVPNAFKLIIGKKLP
jgi:hypothetical protein